MEYVRTNNNQVGTSGRSSADITTNICGHSCNVSRPGTVQLAELTTAPIYLVVNYWSANFSVRQHAASGCTRRPGRSGARRQCEPTSERFCCASRIAHALQRQGGGDCGARWLLQTLTRAARPLPQAGEVNQQAQAATTLFGASRLPTSSPTDAMPCAARYDAIPSLMRLHECGS
jgi:hypothetical protein